jgi:hypothetical protein
VPYPATSYVGWTGTVRGMPRDGDDPIYLVNEELNIVAFVMDYVEFHFNGPKFMVYSRPWVEVGGARHRFPEAGSRDALCLLIGKEVERVEIARGDRIELVMRGGDMRLVIPLDGPQLEHAWFFPSTARGDLRLEDAIEY